MGMQKGPASNKEDSRSQKYVAHIDILCHPFSAIDFCPCLIPAVRRERSAMSEGESYEARRRFANSKSISSDAMFGRV